MSQFSTRFESKEQNRETPDIIIVPLDREFGFTLDVCALPGNAKCKAYFTPDNDGLARQWTGVCWMNPPFNNLAQWVRKAFESARQGCTVVCLVASRTNTNWWHNYCMRGEVRFIRGRPKFDGAKYGLPQPLAIVIFRPPGEELPGLRSDGPRGTELQPLLF